MDKRVLAGTGTIRNKLRITRALLQCGLLHQSRTIHTTFLTHHSNGKLGVKPPIYVFRMEELLFAKWFMHELDRTF